MNWKKIFKAILFPPVAVPLILLPIATVLLVYAMAYVGTETPVAYFAYALSAYTLTIICLRIPRLVRFFKAFRQENRFAKRWMDDERLRIKVSLYGSLVWNVEYAAFQLWLGFTRGSVWFFSLSAYYLSFAVMRFFLARHTRSHRRNEDRESEFIRYRACGWIFLLLNLFLSVMVFFMVYFDRANEYTEIIAIAMAAYTFTSFVLAIVSLVKYRKYDSPVYSASKIISLAAACVSILTLEASMLHVFGKSESVVFRRTMLAVTGVAVSVFIVVMAIYMIVRATKQLKRIRSQKIDG